MRGDGLAGVAIADKEYPARPVFSLLTRLLEDYEKEAGKAWRDAPKDCNDAPQFMKDQLKKYQNPQEVRWASLLKRVSLCSALSPRGDGRPSLSPPFLIALSLSLSVGLRRPTS